jgi:hypothetical protein
MSRPSQKSENLVCNPVVDEKKPDNLINQLKRKKMTLLREYQSKAQMIESHIQALEATDAENVVNDAQRTLYEIL